MAPGWLLFNNDQTYKRGSTLVSSNSSPEVYTRHDSAFSPPMPSYAFDSSETDAFDPAVRSSTRQNTLSRKRLSLFARGPSHNHIEEVYIPRDPLPELSAQSDHFTLTSPKIRTKRSSMWPRKKSLKSTKESSAADEPIWKWIRGEDKDSSEQHESVDTEDALHRNRMKLSISSPFNFQHVTHTQQNELPKLESVGDRDLVLGFWASSAQQFPQSDLRGIKAEDIDERQRATRSRPRSSQSQPGSPFSASCPFPHDQLGGLSPGGAIAARAQQLRKMSTTSTQSHPDLRAPSLRDRSPSLASLFSGPRSPPLAIHPALRNPAEWSPSISDVSSRQSNTLTDTPASEHSIGLDAVPEEHEHGSTHASPLRSKHRRSGLILDTRPQNCAEHNEPPTLNPSLDSTTSSGWQSRDETDGQWKRSQSSHCSGESWEDEIDYIYQAEAESTCNFDWDSRAGSITAMDLRGFALQSPPIGHLSCEYSPANDSPRASIARHQRAKSSMVLANIPTIADVRDYLEVSGAPPSPLTATRMILPEIPSISPMPSTWPRSEGQGEMQVGYQFPYNMDDEAQTPRGLRSFAGSRFVHAHTRSLGAAEQASIMKSNHRRWSSAVTFRERPKTLIEQCFNLPTPQFERPRPPPQIPLPMIPVQPAGGDINFMTMPGDGKSTRSSLMRAMARSKSTSTLETTAEGCGHPTLAMNDEDFPAWI